MNGSNSTQSLRQTQEGNGQPLMSRDRMMKNFARELISDYAHTDRYGDPVCWVREFSRAEKKIFLTYLMDTDLIEETCGGVEREDAAFSEWEDYMQEIVDDLVPEWMEAKSEYYKSLNYTNSEYL